MKTTGKKISEWMKGRRQRILLSFFVFIFLTACTSGGSLDSSGVMPEVEGRKNAVDTSEISEHAEDATDASETSEEEENVTAGNATTEGASVESSETQEQKSTYTFRKARYLTEHFRKHGAEMGAKSEESYLEMANAVIDNPDALHKLEAEDDDHVYFIEDTHEIVFLSQDGYIRTYFICSGIEYFNRQ